MIRSVPELLARAHGVECVGPLACFFCGAACDGSRPTTTYVKETFTGWAGVAAPASPGVCEGCVLAFADAADIPLLNDSTKRVAKNAMRSFSWLLATDRATAGTKADLARWRALALDPPSPPWSIVLSDRGQKHLLYRGVVNHGGPPFAVTLEEERIDYRPTELSARLNLCDRLWIAGFPARSPKGPSQINGDPCPIGAASRLDESDLYLWDRVRPEPLTRLAAWLAENPNKEKPE